MNRNIAQEKGTKTKTIAAAVVEKFEIYLLVLGLQLSSFFSRQDRNFSLGVNSCQAERARVCGEDSDSLKANLSPSFLL